MSKSFGSNRYCLQNDWFSDWQDLKGWTDSYTDRQKDKKIARQTNIQTNIESFIHTP